MNASIYIHDVVETTTIHQERNDVRWTKIVVVDASGHETEIVLFPDDQSDDLQIDAESV